MCEIEEIQKGENQVAYMGVALLLTCSRGLVLVRNKYSWGPVAGSVQNEVIPEAVLREAQEEVKLASLPTGLRFVATGVFPADKAHTVGYLYEAWTNETPNWVVTGDPDIEEAKVFGVAEVIQLIDGGNITHPEYNVDHLLRWVAIQANKIGNGSIYRTWVVDQFKAGRFAGFGFIRDPVMHCPFLVFTTWKGNEIGDNRVVLWRLEEKDLVRI